MIGLRSLRVRLVVLFVVIFGAFQAVFGIVGLLAAEDRLRAHFDQELLHRTRGMVEELRRSQQRWLPQPLPQVIDEQTSSIFFRGFYVQLRDGDGELIERSANLGAFELPYPAEPDTRAGRYRLQSLRGPEVEELLGRSDRLRMVTRWIDAPDMDPLILQVAASQQPLEAVIGLLRTLFGIAVPIGLLAASVAGWWVTGRALREVRLVSEFAGQVTPERLDHQLPPPRHDDEIGQMVVHVNQMLQRLKAGFDAQEHFLHAASHELKTPLSSLLSEAQWLKRREVSAEEHRQFIGSVEQESRHLSQLVESLLLLTRSDSGRTIYQREVTSINDAVETAAQECRPMAELAEVRLTLQLAMPEADGELLVCGDGALLSVMVGNLIRNAVRFSPAGQQVQVEVTRHGPRAEIVVRDHGPGVPPPALDRIFDRFMRVEAHGPRRGMGLGLAIAREVARFHGGDIRVSNMDDGGCAFTVTLPLSIADTAPTGQPAAPAVED